MCPYNISPSQVLKHYLSSFITNISIKDYMYNEQYIIYKEPSYYYYKRFNVSSACTHKWISELCGVLSLTAPPEVGNDSCWNSLRDPISEARSTRAEIIAAIEWNVFLTYSLRKEKETADRTGAADNVHRAVTVFILHRAQNSGKEASTEILQLWALVYQKEFFK